MSCTMEYQELNVLFYGCIRGGVLAAAEGFLRSRIPLLFLPSAHGYL